MLYDDKKIFFYLILTVALYATDLGNRLDYLFLNKIQNH